MTTILIVSPIIIKNCANYNVIKIPKDEPLKVAAEIILVKHIGSAIIVDENKPVGIVTERDLIKASYKRDDIDINDKISKIMSSPICAINENADAETAIRIMIEKGYRQLGVTNDNGTLVAICSMSELISNISEAKQLLTKTQILFDRLGKTDTATMISQEIDLLLSDMSDRDFDDTDEGNKNLQELFIRLKKLANNGVELTYEEPQLLLLINTDGLNLYTKKLSDTTINGQLMSGFFHALNQWMREIVFEDGYIDRIKYQNFTIIMKSINQSLLCYIFKGETYSGFKTVGNLTDALLNDEKISEFLKNSPNNISESMEQLLTKRINEVFSQMISYPILYI